MINCHGGLIYTIKPDFIKFSGDFGISVVISVIPVISVNRLTPEAAIFMFVYDRTVTSCREPDKLPQ